MWLPEGLFSGSQCSLTVVMLKASAMPPQLGKSSFAASASATSERPARESSGMRYLVEMMPVSTCVPLATIAGRRHAAAKVSNAASPPGLIER